ncbi:MAG: hypothetical protein CBD12_003085 [Amoebophilaceae bacterium TMED152]|nr:MAG: hypothetical protein CBD12_003085 [Amoebophilaceae bacterium TMED152]|tara:strand:- start:5259 stop:6362 length:1104 start_codon:yes stop_codon:yes gene_type:complete
MKIFIDKNIPYVEHLFADHIDQIEYFSDEDFEIENIKEDSVVVVRSTYKTHGKKIPKSVKFLCSASTGEDHIDKKELNKMKIPYAFSTGANAIAVREYIFSTTALMLQEKKFNKTDSALIIGCGNIGEGVYKTLKYFGFNISSYDPYKWSTNSNEDLEGYSLISLHVPFTTPLESEHYTEKLFSSSKFKMCVDGAIIINTSRGGVVSEEDFLGLDTDQHHIRLISDVFANEPNINKDFLGKNLFGTPHIAGHSQYARYQMTKMASEHIDNFLGMNDTEKKNILENKIVNFDKNVFDADIKEFGLPVSLMLDTYNPKLDHFKSTDFKKIRDNYNDRIGYSQIIIKGCDNDADRISLEMLGFTVQDSQK